MQRIETSLPGVYELRQVIHRDSRGSFFETYHFAEFANLGITAPSFKTITPSLPARRFAVFTINCVTRKPSSAA